MTTMSPIQSKQDLSESTVWVPVCTEQDLVDNSGVCVLVGNQQIAVFSMTNYEQELSLYACDNHDPLGKANVLSRGILCSIGDIICVCSPLYKQHFSLLDGQCLEQEDTKINVYPVKLEQGTVSLSVPANLAI